MTNLKTKEIAIIDAQPFAQILSSLGTTGFSELAYCPLQLIESNTLLGHLSKNNPLMKAVKENSMVKAIFSGPHGYISPRWHKEQVVPTWNYATVSLTCRLEFIENIDGKLDAMKAISHYFDPQWNFQEFNQESNNAMVQKMLSAISVFKLNIIDVKSKFKLSQNRSVECRTAFQTNLRLTGYNDLADIQLL
jgi:transcriptional regulator